MNNTDKVKNKVDELLKQNKKASFSDAWEFVRWNEISHKEEYELWDYWLKKGGRTTNGEGD